MANRTSTRVVFRQASKLRVGDQLWRPFGRQDQVLGDPVRRGLSVAFDTAQGRRAEIHYQLVPIILEVMP